MAYNVSENYKKVIYSGESKSKLRLWFNEVELEDADYYCEKITVSSRILPNDSSKRFTLDNFVSKEVELILHDVDMSLIKDKIKIEIGNLVDEEYEYVPIGIFNIQDNPTTDKNKITMKLRDNAVLFDFDYNAKPLIDENEGSTTKFEILKDICEKANVICNIEDFIGKDDEIGIYDNTISGRTYISFIAEQAGAIATINRQGELIFVYLNNLVVQRIPLSLVEKYSLGNKYNISRIVYEDAVRKFESGDETKDTLFLNAGNPYISSQDQINIMSSLVIGFEIDSLETGKILGDPSIDSYDLIEIYDNYEENEPTIAKTLANHTLTYNGVLTSVYDTEIGLEQRKENVTKRGEETFKKWAKTEIDNVVAEVKIMTGEVSENLELLTTTTQKVNEFEISIKEMQKSVDTAVGEVNTMAGKITDMNYSFTTKGLSIGTSQDSNNSLFDNTGIKVYNYSTLNAIFNNKGSGIEKLIVTGTAQLGYLRIMKSTKDGKPVTKIFHLKNLIEDLEDLV
jgi:hypothetical protein